MAPALNEPLSPTTTEKLTKSTVSVTTVPVTRSTRRQSALGVSPTLKAANTPSEVGNNNNKNNNNTRQQKPRRSNTPEKKTTTIITRRKTRSKDKTTTESSMGLNVANNNLNKIDSQTSSNKTEDLDKNPTTSSTIEKTDTTQEILANLTINFEEAISAEICLRKQLLDSNLNKEAAKKTNGTELKDILVIKGVSDVGEAEKSQHMESVLETASAKSLDKILLQNKNDDDETLTTDHHNNHNDDVDDDSKKDVEKNVEEVDTLEARLSQLDGSLCDTSNIKPTTTIEDDEHDLEDLHAQLQLSPVKSTQDDELKDLQLQLQLPSPSKSTHDELKELQAQLQLSPVKSTNSSNVVDLNELQLLPTNNNNNNNKTTTTTDMGAMEILVNVEENTNIPQIVSNTGDIEEEDLEEVIRALKGFDPATAGPETLCDLNAIFGDVYQNMNYEDVNTNNNSNNNNNNNTQSSAAIMSCISSISPIKSNPLQDAQLEIDKIQQAIERKLEFLIRRLRKLQARHMCKHTSEELAGIFEYTVRTVNNTLGSSSLLGLESNDRNELSKKPVYMSVISARPAPELWQKERETSVPATQVYNLMRKIETTAKDQQLCTISSSTLNKNLNPLRKSRKSSIALDATRQTPTSIEAAASSTITDSIIPTLDALAVEEIAQVTGMLQAEMREVQQSIDSEATESSSGCESADEMISYNNHIQQALPIEKRAAWRYARDRAAIAARWSWLISHMADIDIKIRQHKELLNEIVRNKGPVIDDVNNTTNEPDEDRGSCRTRGCLSTQFRKRKLLQTPNIHTISKKAARPSTIKCGCQWPMQPCALCTGRSDPTAPRELPNTMVKFERVALLDAGFHPVLSLPEDVSSSIYSEAVARLSDWQQRAMRCQAKTIAKSVWKAEREATGGGSNNRKYDGNTVKRRYIKKKDRLAAEAAEAATGTGTITNVTTTTPKNVEGEGGGMGGALAEKNGRLKQKRSTTTTTTATRESLEVMDAHYQTMSSNYPAQKYDGYNNAINQTLNLHKNNNRFHRNRKAFSSSSSSSSFSATATHKQNHPQNHTLLIKNNHHNHVNHSQYHHSNGNSSSSETAHHQNINNNNNNNLHLHDNWDYETSMRSRTASPTHAQNCHQRSERKRSSYDIDNIVIPYSVAASTRVEIIPYKEIATPKWRIIGSDDERDETCEDEEEKQDCTVISGECNEKVTTPKCEEIKSEDSKVCTEDLNVNKKESMEKTEIIEQKVSSTDKDSSSLIKAEEIPQEEQTEAVKIEEHDLKDKDNNVLIETAEKSKELIENTDKETEIEKENDVVTIEKQEESKKIEEQPKSFREKLDISSEEFPEEDGQEESLEDITDAVMSVRHERGLIEERRKFQTYLKFPWTTRSRANRRGDSRAESSGANTPDPTSPAPIPGHLVGGDQESIPSPATTLALSTPTTPFTPLDSATPDALHGPFAAFDNRKHRNNNINNRKRCRTSSSKKDQERRSPSPDTREIILPYEPLKFPLSDIEFDDMQCLIPIERRPEPVVKQENNVRKTIGSYGRGRNGLRRQGHNTTNTLIRSLRPRISNRPYVMDTKDMSGLDSFENTLIAGEQQTLHLSGKTSMAVDNAEETEDETETCGLDGVARKNDSYTDDDDDDDDLDEDEDDGFPRNPLATAEDNILTHATNTIEETPQGHCNSDEVNNAYAAYVGHSDMFSDCEMDSSDPEPFKDDDPNDPEWNGEPRRNSRM